MKELPSHKKRKRAILSAFSPDLKARINAARSELGIPLDGFPIETSTDPEEARGFYPKDAVSWYENHVQQSVGKQKELPKYYWHFPEEFAELIDNFAYSPRPCRAGFHPEVPLDCQAMDLVHEFGLPEDVVNEVKRRILVEESGSFASPPPLQLIFIPVNEHEEGIKYLACIAGINGDTTQKDWLDVWRQIRKIIKMSDVEISPTKREGEENQLRDLSWWKWSMQGLTNKQVADKWEEEKGESYAEDTIGAAIRRVGDDMSPLSKHNNDK